MAEHKFTTGGTVQAGGGIYLFRRADDELYRLCRDHQYAYVLTSRQVGKSSLMVKTAERLREADFLTATVDLTQIGTDAPSAKWYFGILDTITEQLFPDFDLSTWWLKQPEDRGMTPRLIQFFERELLTRTQQDVVIFIDEIDKMVTRRFKDDFFAAIRFLYQQRRENAELRRLSFVLVGVATPNDLIEDPTRTPFNIGTRVELTDFTLTEAVPLAGGFNLPPERAQQVLQWVLDWTGGHPYLTQRVCAAIVEQNPQLPTRLAIDDLVEQTFFGENSKKDSNLKFVARMLTQASPEPAVEGARRADSVPDAVIDSAEILRVLRAYLKVVRSGSIPDREQSSVHSHLKLSGVVGSRDGKLRVRNAIYATVFGASWVTEHIRDLETDRVRLLRQLRRTVVALVTLLFLALIPLSLYAFRAKSRAEKLAHDLSVANKALLATNGQLQTTNQQLQQARTDLTAKNSTLNLRNKQLDTANQNYKGANDKLAITNRQLVESRKREAALKLQQQQYALSPEYQVRRAIEEAPVVQVANSDGRTDDAIIQWIKLLALLGKAQPAFSASRQVTLESQPRAFATAARALTQIRRFKEADTAWNEAVKAMLSLAKPHSVIVPDLQSSDDLVTQLLQCHHQSLAGVLARQLPDPLRIHCLLEIAEYALRTGDRSTGNTLIAEAVSLAIPQQSVTPLPAPAGHEAEDGRYVLVHDLIRMGELETAERSLTAYGSEFLPALAVAYSKRARAKQAARLFSLAYHRVGELAGQARFDALQRLLIAMSRTGSYDKKITSGSLDLILHDNSPVSTAAFDALLRVIVQQKRIDLALTVVHQKEPYPTAWHSTLQDLGLFLTTNSKYAEAESIANRIRDWGNVVSLLESMAVKLASEHKTQEAIRVAGKLEALNNAQFSSDISGLAWEATFYARVGDTVRVTAAEQKMRERLVAEANGIILRVQEVDAFVDYCMDSGQIGKIYAIRREMQRQAKTVVQPSANADRVLLFLAYRLIDKKDDLAQAGAIHRQLASEDDRRYLGVELFIAYCKKRQFLTALPYVVDVIKDDRAYMRGDALGQDYFAALARDGHSNAALEYIDRNYVDLNTDPDKVSAIGFKLALKLQVAQGLIQADNMSRAEQLLSELVKAIRGLSSYNETSHLMAFAARLWVALPGESRLRESRILCDGESGWQGCLPEQRLDVYTAIAQSYLEHYLHTKARARPTPFSLSRLQRRTAAQPGPPS